MSRHPSVPYDDGLIAAIADGMDLRKPNRLALDTVVSDLSDADPDETWVGVCDVATAVGKTYLAAALISYLAESDVAVRHFLIVVPNRTIYQKTIDNYTPGHPKSVLEGMPVLPVIVTPDNFNAGWVAASLEEEHEVKVFIFKIQGLTEPTEKTTRRTRDEDNEILGGSLYQRLQEAPDLVILSDEHHMYAPKAKVFSRAIADLDPLAVIGLTATPDKSQEPQVVYHYPLAQAIADELVKTPVIVGRTDERFDLDTRLRDGLLLLEAKKVAADTYSQVEKKPRVNPVMLVVAENIDQAQAVTARLRRADMLGADDAVLEIHSDTDDDQLEKLLHVEDNESPVRAIVSVQMLGVGWDVKNVYVILSLRKSVSEVLTEQTLGRGMRLPWGSYTGVELLDTLEVLAHERYRELLNKADKILEGLVQSGEIDSEKAAAAAKRRRAREAAAAAMDAAKAAAAQLALAEASPEVAPGDEVVTPPAVVVEDLALEASEIPAAPMIRDSTTRLAEATAQNLALGSNVVMPRPDVLVELPEVTTTFTPAQFNLSALAEAPFEDIGKRLASGEAVTLLREVMGVTLKDDGGLAYNPHHAKDHLNASSPAFEPGAVTDELRLGMIESDLVPATGQNPGAAARLAHVIVRGAGGETALAPHLRSAVSAINALLVQEHRKLVPSKTHQVTSALFAPYRANVRPLEANRYGAFSRTVAYSGWERGLHPAAWFDSKPERDAANIFDADPVVEVWVRLLSDDLVVKWQQGIYQPDFYVRTTDSQNYVVEIKMNKELTSAIVQGKKAAAVEWVQIVDDAGFGRWRYLLLSESAVANCKTFEQLRRQAL